MPFAPARTIYDMTSDELLQRIATGHTIVARLREMIGVLLESPHPSAVENLSRHPSGIVEVAGPSVEEARRQIATGFVAFENLFPGDVDLSPAATAVLKAQTPSEEERSQLVTRYARPDEELPEALRGRAASMRENIAVAQGWGSLAHEMRELIREIERAGAVFGDMITEGANGESHALERN